ncbi:MAG: hypothetical protein GY750_20745 [Lentisphaerae bacterium]|nr:hypothetical protein [Lentisphaerota bacterium]MCP4103820.1 hypothetical protein [Lentisphaerota bacterium]
MPKFRKAIFIDFNADEISDKPYSMGVSYFYDKRKSLKRKETIDVYTAKKRKALYKDKIPYIRINFPYNGAQGRYSNDKLNVSKVCDNYAAAQNLMSKELCRLEPYSRIYVNAHGEKDDDTIGQMIKLPDKNELMVNDITAESFADTLNKYIPKYARNNIQIFMLACEATLFAKKLMNELIRLGFRKTSVLAYIYPVFIEEGSKRNKYFSLADAGTEVEGMYSLTKFASSNIAHNDNTKNNKIVFHNYGDAYTCHEVPYADFKQKYQNRVYLDTYGLTEAQHETVLLQNMLFQSLADYLINYEKSTYHGTIEFHGGMGYKRARFLCDQLLLVNTESIINSNNIEIINENIITNIKSFTKQTGLYSQFGSSFFWTHNINVNDDSAIDLYFEKFGKIL